MTARSLVRRHAALITLVIAFELALGFVLTRFAVTPFRARLSTHPDGLRALFAEGGRGALDLGERLGTITVIHALTPIVLGLLGYALISRITETLVASALVTDRISIRPLPRVVVVHLATLVLLALAVFAGGLSVSGANAFVHSWHDARAADLVVVATVIPVAFVALTIHLVDDLALIRCAGANDLLDAMSSALTRIRRAPMRRLLPRLAFLTATLALTVVGALASWRADRALDFAVVTAIVFQQLAAASRVFVRVQWLAHLAAEWRAESAAEPNA